LEDLETFASFAVAAIVTPGRLAAAAMQAPPSQDLANSLFQSFSVPLPSEWVNGVNAVLLQERYGIYHHLSVKG
jgi:hypothetical protein